MTEIQPVSLNHVSNLPSVPNPQSASARKTHLRILMWVAWVSPTTWTHKHIQHHPPSIKHPEKVIFKHQFLLKHHIDTYILYPQSHKWYRSPLSPDQTWGTLQSSHTAMRNPLSMEVYSWDNSLSMEDGLRKPCLIAIEGAREKIENKLQDMRISHSKSLGLHHLCHRNWRVVLLQWPKAVGSKWFHS